ncbi:GNAT family N-acetyltransferase [Sabulicella rubraurantiaca]|uniref:GNAT family N-acetyltransferase n=1 Tax=Sabulicella rubraurantiaca TaxID=2811429 RepID=UPI001A976AB9|nr:GNAT family N-acetyltransferase [Sabulicella rubraurantiaca]
MPRLAKAGEAEALHDLVRGAYAHYVPRLGREPFPMTDDYAARIRAGQAWVEEQDGQILGVLVLEDTPEGLLLDNIAVAASLRGQGIGRKLLRFVEEEALRRGHPRVWLYTNEKMTENIALYTRLGYAETHRGEEKGFRRVFMEKRLA